MRYAVLFIACVIGAILFAGCTQQTPSQTTQPEEIKIGVIVSMTGPASNVGKNMWQSAVVAADEINADGGVFIKEYNKKIPIRLIQGDDESTQQGGQKAVTKLITDDKVDILVGGYSSAVTSTYEQIVADHKVPFIVTGASSPIITHRTDIDTSYIFHHCPTTDSYGQYTTWFIDQVIRPAINAKFGFPDDRNLRVAIIYQDSPFGKGGLSAMNNTITNDKLKMEIVGQQSYKMGESDFRTVLTSIKATNPDVVYAVVFPNEMAQMLPQARRDVQMDTIFLVPENNDAPEYYKGIGNYGEYSIIESRFSPYTAPKGPIADAAMAFKNKFKDKWGAFPDMMGASTYEGIYIAAKVSENAGTLNKDAIRQALGTLSMPQMVEAMSDGTISFSKDFRESRFDLYMEQLIWDPTVNECRPVIVWPDALKDTSFVLPDWYKPGSA
jgi:branched-chain amino acid transport system substrate-binding protein